jgi:deoxyadenosine/deoxycytidine kinase
MVYLHGPLETILERIASRGRPKEKDTDPEYFASLHGRYAKWIEDFRRCPVLRIDVREYDLVGNPSSVDDLATRVRLELEKELPQTELWPAQRRRKEPFPLG